MNDITFGSLFYNLLFMSVVLTHVSKVFGTQIAVNDLSFTANKSEILGFLGPNGAGKTTTMKVITGFHSPDQGEVEICGINLKEHPLAAKKLVGYLPENNPLYKDMYVREYLNTFAQISKIDHAADRIDELIKLTGLTKEQNKYIGQLSKGYRQRVGLSQALLNDPEVLILDEPTSGLDPNQILEIRELIRNISKEKTIIFSTHIMQEVKLLCDRVIIINNGKLVADDSIQEIQNRIQDRQIVHVEFRMDPPIEQLKLIDSVDSVRTVSKGKYTFYSSSDMDLRDLIYDACQKNNWQIREMIKDRNSVEEIFTLLTS